MKTEQRSVSVRTGGRGLCDVTAVVRETVRASGIVTGVCHVFITHTSASLVIQENADPAVLHDMERWIARVAPESSDYEHDDEGPDDMPAHLRAAITKTSETIPIQNQNLALGTWQALYLWEHRSHPHERTLLITLMGA